MGKAIIPVVSIPRNTPYQVDLTVDEADISLHMEQSDFLSTVHVQGNLTAIQEDYLFQGTLTGCFERSCDRCLAPTTVESSVDVAWIFEPGTRLDPMEEFAQSEETKDDEDTDLEGSDGVQYYDGVSIDLAPGIAEEILMIAPTKIYCVETCKGLCPQCGGNLNTSTCDCTPEAEIKETNSGFSGLKDMFPDLPSDPLEE